MTQVKESESKGGAFRKSLSEVLFFLIGGIGNWKEGKEESLTTEAALWCF